MPKRKPVYLGANAQLLREIERHYEKRKAWAQWRAAVRQNQYDLLQIELRERQEQAKDQPE